MTSKKDFEVCVRGILTSRGKILVARNKAKGYYFFPGGHVEFGEKLKETLSRELKEELGIRPKDSKFIGVVDNVFKDEGLHHEVDFVFEVKTGGIRAESKENHIDFKFFTPSEFSKASVYPLALKKAIVKWMKDGKVFQVSQYYK
ncbi:NUDIX domain-containing protein [Patescibacteria group bacterium]|jgi:ADP-ribose pyrophosphatase YjhB (NUDIX family)|nr:NUDIX domain-containing protein [Patescibacteria group bacterium]MCL5114797.1 NUDIX domain-containing protein [Patescibacteria group bacterium]